MRASLVSPPVVGYRTKSVPPIDTGVGSEISRPATISASLTAASVLPNPVPLPVK